MNGSRLLTTMMSWPRSSPCSVARSRSCVQSRWLPSSGRYWRSRSRISSRRSRSIGRSSGAVRCRRGAGFLRPRSSARSPCTQPRHESWAMTTVISATIVAHRDEEVEDVAPRLVAAPLDEAHVVHEHQAAVRAASAPSISRTPRCTRPCAVLQQALAAPPSGRRQRRAADFGREGEGGNRLGRPGRQSPTA